MSELVKSISTGIIGFKNKDRDMSPHADVINRNGGSVSGMKRSPHGSSQFPELFQE